MAFELIVEIFLYLVLILYYIHGVTKRESITPCLVFLGANFVFVFLSFNFYNLGYDDEIILGASFDSKLNNNEIFGALEVFLRYNIYVLLGLSISRMFNRNVVLHQSEVLSFKLEKLGIQYLFLCIAPILFYIIGAGSNLLSSQNYIVDTNRIFSSLGNMTALPCASVLGMYWSRKDIKFVKLIVIIILFALILVLFGRATRALALIPLFFWFGKNISQKSKISLTSLVVTTVVSVLLLALPIYLRKSEMHGILPYIEHLSNFEIEMFYVGVPILINNVLSNYSLTWIIYQNQSNFDISYFLTSVNPLPGDLTNWSHIRDSLRLNKFTPYNTIGEIFLYGELIAFLTSTFIGWFYNHLDYHYSRFRIKNNFIYLVYIAIPLLMVITSFQYNLRTSFRLIYYMLLLTFFVSRIRIAFIKN